MEANEPPLPLSRLTILAASSWGLYQRHMPIVEMSPQCAISPAAYPKATLGLLVRRITPTSNQAARARTSHRAWRRRGLTVTCGMASHRVGMMKGPSRLYGRTKGAARPASSSRAKWSLYTARTASARRSTGRLATVLLMVAMAGEEKKRWRPALYDGGRQGGCAGRGSLQSAYRHQMAEVKAWNPSSTACSS